MSKARAKSPIEAVTYEGSPAAIKVKPSGPSKAEKHSQETQELAMQIDAMRESLVEMVDNYRFKVDAELIQLSMAARGEATPNATPVKLSHAKLKKMLDVIKELDIKAKKGRAKDFGRLHDAVEELIELLPTEK